MSNGRTVLVVCTLAALLSLPSLYNWFDKQVEKEEQKRRQGYLRSPLWDRLRKRYNIPDGAADASYRSG